MAFDNSTVLSLCIPPFLAESEFPPRGGYVAGRYCAALTLTGGVSCCLPCPQAQWVYPDSYHDAVIGVDWVGIVGMVCSIFLLASYLVLPVDQTNRFHVTTCVVVSIMIMTMPFIISLGAKPDQCFDAITPNDMHTNLACAWTGACLIAGGFCTIMWVLMCALKLHLQICWKVVVDRKFFIAAQILGWGIPFIITTESLALGGVSYRMGPVCIPNHKDALGGIWVPALILAASTVVVQFSTIGYCTKVYFECHMSSYGSGSGLFSSGSRAGTFGSASSRQTYNRVMGLIKMQWRGFVMVLLIIFDVIFFCVIFVIFDNKASFSAAEVQRAEPWLICLALHEGNKYPCLHLTDPIVENEAIEVTVFVLLAFNGIWAFLLLSRWSMFQGWARFHRKRVVRGHRLPREKSPMMTIRRPPIDIESHEALRSPVADTFESSEASTMTIPRKPIPSTQPMGETWSYTSPSSLHPLSAPSPMSPVSTFQLEKPLPSLPREVVTWHRDYP